jgi:hypothetical protein
MFGTEVKAGAAAPASFRTRSSSLADAELQKLIKLLHQVQAALDESGL